MENLQGGTLALEHRYHIEAHRGSFGLISLYEGTQEPFALPVRILVYEGLPDAGADPEISRRVKESAARGSRHRDGGLLTVLDFGELDRGLPFVVEENPEGTTIAEEIARRGALPPEEIADVIQALAELLHPLHRGDQTHGCIAPQWVLVPTGKDRFRRSRLSATGLGLTMKELLAMPQAVLTTDLVDSFAPEAFASSSEEPFPTPASDQWALAALAYRMFVGVHPFFDDPVDASDGIIRIKSDEAPSLTEMGIDDAIADAISRGLSRDPSDRYRSVSSFAAALREAISGPEAADDARSDDDVALEPRRARSSQEDLEEQAPQSTAGPQPSGYLLTVALAVLLLSNLGWFFITMTPPSEVDEGEAVVSVSRTTLPSGLQLQTIPAGAAIFELLDGAVADDATPVGTTPFVLTTPEGSRDFILRLPGFQEQAFTLEETAAGQDLRLILQEDPGDVE